MSQNILNTEQGSAFFIDFEQVIADEKINIEKAKKKNQEHKKHSGGTAIYIPLFDDKTGSSGKVTQNENKNTNDLNLTFTKQDFEQLKSKTELFGSRNTISSPCPPSEGNYRTRPSSSIQRVKTTFGNLKKVHSSPDLLSSPRLPQLEKSHQELKELITEYDKKEKGHFQEVLTTTYARLPKLPQWATNKQMSLDLHASSFNINKTVGMDIEGNTKQEYKITDHQVQIEELYSDLNSKDSGNQQSSFPPILNPTTTTVVPKRQGNNKPNVKKAKKHNSQNPPATINKNRPQTNNQTRKNCSTSAQKDTRLPRSNLNKKKIKANKKSKKKGSNQTIDPDERTSIGKNDVEEILDNIEFKLGNTVCDFQENKISSDSEQFSMEDSIEVFYDNLLNAKPTIETTLLSFPKVNHTKDYHCSAIDETKHEMIRNNADLYTTFEKFTKSKYKGGTNANKVFDFDLVESMEKTLSIDDTFFITTPKAHHHQPAFNIYPELSNVTEEKSPFTTIQSKSNINSRLLSSSHDIFTSEESNAMSKSIETFTNANLSDGHFQEITNLVFQQGGDGIISGSTSLDSISINNSITSSSSNNATLTERPYLKSVLGQTSARSLYTSSSNVTDDSSLEDGVLEWQKGKVIDRGAFGVVYQGLTNTGQMIAVKEVNINHSKNANKVYVVF